MKFNDSGMILTAAHTNGHQRFYIIVHSLLVLVKFFEAGGLAQSHTTGRASKRRTVWSLSLHSRALMAPTPLQANV